MQFRRPIRDLRSETQQVFCYVVIEDGVSFLEVKNSRKKTIKVPLSDIEQQIKIAQSEASNN